MVEVQIRGNESNLAETIQIKMKHPNAEIDKNISFFIGKKNFEAGIDNYRGEYGKKEKGIERSVYITDDPSFENVERVFIKGEGKYDNNMILSRRLKAGKEIVNGDLEDLDRDMLFDALEYYADETNLAAIEEMNAIREEEREGGEEIPEEGAEAFVVKTERWDAEERLEDNVLEYDEEVSGDICQELLASPRSKKLIYYVLNRINTVMPGMRAYIEKCSKPMVYIKKILESNPKISSEIQVLWDQCCIPEADLPSERPRESGENVQIQT